MNTDSILDALRQSPALAIGSDAALAALAAAATPVSFAAGEVVFDTGDAQTEVFVVIDGTLRARLSAEGNLISVFEAGAVFGEYAMFTGGVRSARVVAADAAVLLRIDADAFRQFLMDSPQTTLLLLETAVRRLSRAERQRHEA